MKALEQILQDDFGCKNPFLKNKKRYDEDMLYPFTVAGGKAYAKLIDVLYAVDTIVDDKDYSYSLEHVINQLDEICNE